MESDLHFYKRTCHGNPDIAWIGDLKNVRSMMIYQAHFALKFTICLTLASIFQFTPSTIFIKSSRLPNKIGSLLQVYFMNFLL